MRQEAKKDIPSVSYVPGSPAECAERERIAEFLRNKQEQEGARKQYINDWKQGKYPGTPCPVVHERRGGISANGHCGPDGGFGSHEWHELYQCEVCGEIIGEEPPRKNNTLRKQDEEK